MESSLSRLPKGLSFKSRSQDVVSSAEDPVSLKGDKGDLGETGADGIDGIDGADGATGPPGSTGATGATGPAGADGVDGTDGADGAVGPTGPIGPTGPQGPEGPTGPQGPKGGDSIITNKFGTRAVGLVEGTEGQWLDVVPASEALEPWLEEALVKVTRFRSICGNFDLVVGTPKHCQGWRMPEKTLEKASSVMNMWKHITNGTLFEEIKKQIKDEILAEIRNG